MLTALLRQRRRLVLATVAIALGVGYLAGALTLLDRVGSGLSNLAQSGVGAEDLVVEGEVAYESSLEQVRRLVPSSVADEVRTLPGVQAVTPRIEDIAVVLGADGRPVVAPGLSEQPIGANWPAGAPVAPYDLVAGVPPTGSGDVVLDQGTAASGELEVGDRVSIAGRTRVGSYRVSGIVGSGSGGLPPGASLALFSTAEARDLFDRPFDDNWVGVTVADGADVAEVEQTIAAQLPAGVVVVDAATAAADRQDGLTRSFALVRTLLIGFAALALLVGMVTVANSLALLYAERRRTFASFRLVGAKPRQLLVAALVEAGLLALVASAIGAPLGLLVGKGIESVLSALGSPIPVAGPLVSWSAIGWAVCIGVVATVAAAVVPALKVCRVSPIEAVDDASTVPQPRVLDTLRTAGIAAVLAGGAVAVLLLQGQDTTVALTAGAVAAAVVFLIGLTPMALAAVVAGGVRVVPVPPAALRRIASRDVRRSRTRTAATTGALALATAVIVTLAVCLSSFVASLDAEVARTVRADLVVDSGTFTRGGLPAELLTDLEAVDGVSAVSGWQLARGTVGSTPIRATGLDAGAALDVVGFDFVGPAPTGLQSDSILLSEQAAAAAGVDVGSTVPVVFTSGGTEYLDVAGVFRGGGALIGDAVIDRTVVLRQVPATPDLAALVTLDPAVPGAGDAVTAVAAEYGVTAVLQPEQFVDQRSDLLRGFQRVIQWMLLFTLLQALVGVVNTLLLSVGERRREFGLLRATGATRAQLHRMVLLEGVALAVVGALIGLAAGLVLSRLALVPLAPLGLDTYVVPVTAVAIVALLAVVVGVLSAVLPARFASRVPPLQAVSDTGDLELRRRRRTPAARPEPVVVPVPATPPPVVVPAAAAVPAPVVVPAAVVVPPAVVVPAAAAVPDLHFDAGSSSEAPAVAAPGLGVVAPIVFDAIAGGADSPAAGVGSLPQVASAAALPPVDVYLAPGGAPAQAPPPVETRRSIYVRSAQAVTGAPVEAPRVLVPPPVPLPPSVLVPPPVPVAPSVLVPPPVPAPRRPLFGRVERPVVAPVVPPPVVSAPLVPPPFVAEPVAPEPLAPEPVAAELPPGLFDLHPPTPADATPEAAPVPASGAPRRRRRVFDRRAARTTRRRQERTADPVADPAVGFLREDVELAPSESSVDQSPAPTLPGAPSPSVAPGAPWSGAGAAGGPPPAVPPPAGPPPGSSPGWSTGPNGPMEPAEPIEPLEPIVEPTPISTTLSLVADALAPGEQVRQVVLGRTAGLDCALARTDRRILVVAARPGRPFVQSLHPQRTAVHVLGPRSLPASVVVIDGDRRLEITGVSERAEAERLAAG